MYKTPVERVSVTRANFEAVALFCVVGGFGRVSVLAEYKFW